MTAVQPVKKQSVGTEAGGQRALEGMFSQRKKRRLKIPLMYLHGK